MMRTSLDDRAKLLVQSLRAWRVSGEVRARPTGRCWSRPATSAAHLARAADLPFRWMVSEGERTRGVTSIAGLLRTVRAAVDPGYRPVRLRIAPLPLVPP